MLPAILQVLKSQQSAELVEVKEAIAFNLCHIIDRDQLKTSIEFVRGENI